MTHPLIDSAADDPSTNAQAQPRSQGLSWVTASARGRVGLQNLRGLD
jgi:hypothetical protein